MIDDVQSYYYSWYQKASKWIVIFFEIKFDWFDTKNRKQITE